MVKIYIDAGHGGNDPGATANGLKEKDLTLDIAKRTRKYLNDNYSGHSIKMSRTTDKTVSLSQRTNEANSWGADYFLSIHINAGGGTGFETYTYNGKLYERTLKIQSVIHQEVMRQIKGVTDRGAKRANLHVVREANASAILTENLFIDTKKDADKLKDSKFLDKVAKGHAIGLAKAFDLKGGSTSSSTSTSKPSKPTSKPSKTSKSIATMAKEVIAGKHGSGHANRKKSLGISDAQYQKVRAEVNKRSGVSSTSSKTSKSIAQMAQEVIDGKHGNGNETRRKSLGISQSQYNKVRNEVNKRLGGGGKSSKPKQSISKMASRIINDKNAPTGHSARRKWLGVDNATYQKVRAEVNRRL